MKCKMHVIDRESGAIVSYEYSSIEELSEKMGISLTTAELLHSDSSIRRKVGAMKSDSKEIEKNKKKPKRKTRLRCVETGEIFETVKEVISLEKISRDGTYKRISRNLPIYGKTGKTYVKI